MDNTFICDLDRCEPAGAVSAAGGVGEWRSVAYETRDLAGTMLLAGDETSAPEVTLRLNRSGWHRLSVGLCPSLGASTVQLRLSDDDSFSMLRLNPTSYGEREGHADRIYELRWKEADLTGRDIILSQVSLHVDARRPDGPTQCEKAAVAYVRAVPMSEAEIAALEVERTRADTNRLYGHNDAHGYVYLFRPSTKGEVWRELEPYRNTDFSRIYWEAGMGDLRYYLGEVGRSCGCDGTGDFYRQGDRLHAEAWRGFRDQGLDPLRVARDRARAIGLEFHASYRPAGFFFPPPYDHWNAGGLYLSSPHWRATGKDGSAAPRLSYTYPAVRRFVIDLLSEVAAIGVDGICLLFNRRPPLVDYDPPLIRACIEAHGFDPRELPEDDDRWLDVKAEPLDSFMRELRQALGADMHISACVSNRAECRLHGMALENWIAEGLVDTLIPYTSAPGLDSSAESWPTMEEVEYFAGITRGTKCALSMSILPRFMTGEAYRRKAGLLYEAGVKSLFFWDSAGGFGRADFSSAWSEVCRLGHRSEIADWRRNGEPAFTRPPEEITRLGDYDLSYQTPG